MGIGSLVNAHLAPFGVDVRRRVAEAGATSVVRDPISDRSTCRRVGDDMDARLTADLGDVAAAFLHDHLGAPDTDRLRARWAAVAVEFLAHFRNHPCDGKDEALRRDRMLLLGAGLAPRYLRPCVPAPAAGVTALPLVRLARGAPRSGHYP